MAQITLNSTGVASNGTLALQSNGTTTAVTIDTSQNVGIGTISPTTKLQAVGIIKSGGTGTNGEFNLARTSDGLSVGKISLTESTQILDYNNLMGSGIHTFTINSAERMRIDSSGNVGIGTSSPSAKLDVNGNIAGGSVNVFGTSTPANGINNVTTNALGFFTNSTERARIDSSGNLLVGTATASLTSGEGFKFFYNAGTNPYVGSVMSSSSNSQTNYHLYSTGAAAYRFYVGMGGTVFATSTTISAISDIRYKENIRDLDVGLDKIMELKPRLYDWKEGKGVDIKNARGFIAQEFEEVFPDLIDEWQDPAPEGEEPYKSVRQDLIPVLVKAIQEQQAIITSLTDRLTALEAK